MPLVANSTPDKNVMKFKKADTTLRNVIRELVNSDKYYADDDLGIRRMPDRTGQLLNGTHDGNYAYLCNSMADMVSAKEVDCSGSSKSNVFA